MLLLLELEPNDMMSKLLKHSRYRFPVRVRDMWHFHHQEVWMDGRTGQPGDRDPVHPPQVAWTDEEAEALETLERSTEEVRSWSAADAQLTRTHRTHRTHRVSRHTGVDPEKTGSSSCGPGPGPWPKGKALT